MERFELLLNKACNIPENLEDLSKEELISTLKNIQDVASRIASSKPVKSDHVSNKKIFDFKRYKKRHIALKFLYLGWDYAGFAVQVHTESTIEEHLFKSLKKTKLVEARETSNYHRCGRTDKGVSAFSQVISLDLRTNLLEGKGVITPETYEPSNRAESKTELDYPAILNRVLPPEIRVIGWAPVEADFSARFNCVQRTYKYWFPKGDLDINLVLEAGQKLIGEHDFRNFCKMDVGNGVLNYKRKIFKIDVTPIHLSEGGYQMIELTIVGQAFLWHQIRCIVTILFLIGQGKEDSEVITQLLDVTKHTKKPQYSMSSEIPLVLFECEYENMDWIYDKENIKLVIKHLQKMWTQQSIKTTIIRRMLGQLENVNDLKNSVTYQAESLLPGVKSRVYKHLLDRPVCESLEEKIAYYSKKRKLDAMIAECEPHATSQMSINKIREPDVIYQAETSER